MKRNVLMIADPIIKCYPDYAYPLSIVLNYDWTFDWFYCNFIQLYFDGQDIFNPVRFYYTDIGNNVWNARNPLLSYQVIHRETLSTVCDDIIKFIINAIDNKNYVTLFLDEYYLEDRWAYEKVHSPHAIFIYGYDLEEEIFFTSGYNKYLNFTNAATKFSEIQKGYLNYKLDMYDDNNCTYLMRLNDTGRRYEFDIWAMIEQLSEYVESKDTSHRYNTLFNNQNLYFGMNIYDPLKKHLEATHLYNWDHNSVKPIYLLWEHKRLMLSRIEYLIEKGYLDEDTNCKDNYKEIVSLIEYVKLLFMKYQRKRSKDLIDKVIQSIDDISKKESAVLSQLIAELKRNCTGKDDQQSGGIVKSSRKLLRSLYSLGEKYDKRVEMQFNLSIDNTNSDRIIGILDEATTVTSENFIPIKIKITPQGDLQCIDYDKYETVVNFIHEQADEVKIKIDVNLCQETYDVYITVLGSEKKVGSDLKYNKEALPITDVSRICLITDSINNFSISNLKVEKI